MFVMSSTEAKDMFGLNETRKIAELKVFTGDPGDNYYMYNSDFHMVLSEFNEYLIANFSWVDSVSMSMNYQSYIKREEFDTSAFFEYAINEAIKVAEERNIISAEKELKTTKSSSGFTVVCHIDKLITFKMDLTIYNCGDISKKLKDKFLKNEVKIYLRNGVVQIGA